LATDESSREIGRDYALPLLEFELEEWDDLAHASAVDQDIDVAQFGLNPVYHLADCARLTYIDLECERLAPGFPRATRGSLRTFFLHIHDCDSGAFAGKRDAGSSADATGATRHNGTLILKPHGPVLRVGSPPCIRTTTLFISCL